MHACNHKYTFRRIHGWPSSHGQSPCAFPGQNSLGVKARQPSCALNFRCHPPIKLVITTTYQNLHPPDTLQLSHLRVWHLVFFTTKQNTFKEATSSRNVRPPPLQSTPQIWLLVLRRSPRVRRTHDPKKRTCDGIAAERDANKCSRGCARHDNRTAADSGRDRSTGQIESNYDETTDSFDAMNLKAELLRGVYAYGFERPSAIQQRAIMPVIKGEFRRFARAARHSAPRATSPTMITSRH